METQAAVAIPDEGLASVSVRESVFVFLFFELFEKQEKKKLTFFLCFFLPFKKKLKKKI